MTDATRFQFNNPSVPKAYNEFFVPRLFEPWAKLLLEAADLRRGESVLDVATGPGTVARLAAVRLGAEGRVVAIDIAQAMLDIAKAKAPPPGAAPIEPQFSRRSPSGCGRSIRRGSVSAGAAVLSRPPCRLA
jgi:SAM-dependent methyltransferase